MIVHVEFTQDAQQDAKARITADSVEIAGKLYPRQIKFIYNLNLLVRDYIREARKPAGETVQIKSTDGVMRTGDVAEGYTEK